MAGFAEIAARVAPDYARMLGRLADAMLAEGAEGADTGSAQRDVAATPDLGKDAARAAGMGRAGHRTVPESGRRAPMAMAAGGPMRPANGHVGLTAQGEGVLAADTTLQAEASGPAQRVHSEESPAQAMAGRPGKTVVQGMDAARESAAFPLDASGVRLRMGPRSASGRPAIGERAAPRTAAAGAAGAAGATRPHGVIPAPETLRHGEAMSGRALRIHRPVADRVRRATALAGPGIASARSHAAELPVIDLPVMGLPVMDWAVMNWTLPDLMTPRGWPNAPTPGVDPFADAALEDALGDLLERTALTGGIDL